LGIGRVGKKAGRQFGDAQKMRRIKQRKEILFFTILITSLT